MPATEVPPAFVERWRELGGEELRVEECISAAGRWWIVVRVGARERRWALLHRADPSAAADDLFKMTR